MSGIINYLRNLTGIDSSYTENLIDTRVYLGNIASLSLRDFLPASTTPTSTLDLCASSYQIYKPSDAPIDDQVATKADPIARKEILTKRLFAYYTARFLSGSRHSSEEYSEFADQTENIASQSPNHHAKDIWQAFKQSCFWQEMSTTEKVKATAAYYLFGEIARNFLEDTLNNITDFFLNQYSSKQEVESLFINVLEKFNNFLVNFEGIGKDYVKDSKNLTFKKTLEDHLNSGRFIRAVVDAKPGKALHENQLFITLGELFLECFLPKLRIKDAILHKLDWNVEGFFNKVLWFVPYIVSIVVHLPLILIAYALDYYINHSMKDTLREHLPSIASNIQKNLQSPETLKNIKESVFAQIYKLLEPSDQSSDPISTAQLDDEIRKRVRELTPILFRVANLHSKNGDQEAMKTALDPKSQTMIDEQVDAALIGKIEEALFSVLTLLTTKDFMAKILDTCFDLLISQFTKNEPVQEGKTKDQLLERVNPFVKQSVAESIEDVIGSEASTGFFEVERFFNRYQQKVAPYLQQIDMTLKDLQNRNRLHSALALLDRHRTVMKAEMQQFKDIFEAKYPSAFKQVDTKLQVIAQAQSEAMSHLVQAIAAEDHLNREIQQQKAIQKLLETISDPISSAKVLSEHAHIFDQEFIEGLTQENEKRIALQLEIKNKENSLSFLREEIQDVYSSMNHNRALYLATQNLTYLKNMRHLGGRILTSLPPTYAEKLSPILQEITDPQKQEDSIFQNRINKLKQEIKKIQKDLIKDIEESEAKKQKDTLHMKQECDRFTHQFNREILEKKVSDPAQQALSKISTIQETTSDLKADPTNVIKLTQVATTLAAAVGAGIFSIALPAIIAGAPLMGSSDLIYSQAKKMLFESIYPKVDQKVRSLLDFPFDPRVFRFMTQTSAVILEDELSRRK